MDLTQDLLRLPEDLGWTFGILFAGCTFLMYCIVKGRSTPGIFGLGCAVNILGFAVYFAVLNLVGPPMADVMQKGILDPGVSARLPLVISIMGLLMMLVAYPYYRKMLRLDSALWETPAEQPSEA